VLRIGGLQLPVVCTATKVWQEPNIM
jgi:hypothetical protein